MLPLPGIELPELATHVTSQWAADSIVEMGQWLESYGAWGTGIYFSLTPETQEMYEPGGLIMKGEHDPVCIYARLHIENPVYLAVHSSMYFTVAFEELHGHWLPMGSPDGSYTDLTEVLVRRGFDSVIVHEIDDGGKHYPTMGPGGSQICVFDQRLIEIVKITPLNKGSY